MVDVGNRRGKKIEEKNYKGDVEGKGDCTGDENCMAKGSGRS